MHQGELGFFAKMGDGGDVGKDRFENMTLRGRRRNSISAQK